jgi:hypothetical protein
LISAITLDPVIATTTTALGTGTGNGIEGNVTEIAGTEGTVGVGTIGRGDIRPLTDAKTAGPFKTVSANRTEDTKRRSREPAPSRLAAAPLAKRLPATAIREAVALVDAADRPITAAHAVIDVVFVDAVAEAARAKLQGHYNCTAICVISATLPFFCKRVTVLV